MATGLLDGKVAVVTGAGRGLGRAYARALAASGAAVVVNDVGAALDGTGRDREPAATVAAEIVAAGGRAVADHTDVASIAGGERAVHRAVEELGRVDVVVHSAGITHSAPIPAVDDTLLDAHLAVHLHGAIGAVRGAFASMRDGGSVVLVTSGAGLDPQWPDTSAYACAKAAVYALMRVAAIEGAARRIRVNCIAPLAFTRMSETMLAHSADAAARFDPTLVAPVVVYLASSLSEAITGRVVRVEGRRVGVVEVARGPMIEDTWTPELLAQRAHELFATDPA